MCKWDYWPLSLNWDILHLWFVFLFPLKSSSRQHFCIQCVETQTELKAFFIRYFVISDYSICIWRRINCSSQSTAAEIYLSFNSLELKLISAWILLWVLSSWLLSIACTSFAWRYWDFFFCSFFSFRDNTAKQLAFWQRIKTTAHCVCTTPVFIAVSIIKAINYIMHLTIHWLSTQKSFQLVFFWQFWASTEDNLTEIAENEF